MPDAVWLPWAVVAIAAPLDWWSVLRGRPAVERWAKPAVLVALIGVVLLARAGEAGAADAGRATTTGWLLVALALSLVGDVLLLSDGLTAFLLGHLAYVAAFVASGLSAPGLAAVGALVVVVALGLGRAILPGARADGGFALAAAVTAYMVVIGAMALTGWATGRVLVGLGASVFVVSDTVLAQGRFVQERRWTHVVVMVTYHLAQVLLVAGLLR